MYVASTHTYLYKLYIHNTTAFFNTCYFWDPATKMCFSYDVKKAFIQITKSNDKKDEENIF